MLLQVQDAQKWRECPNKIIAAEPLSWCQPNDIAEGNGSMRKRKRGTFTELEVEKEKEFSLVELYKSNNINEIILDKEKGETVLDPQELLKNLKGWTVEKRKRQENNGNPRIDKIYRHPKSKRTLRSLVEVKKFIKENSYVRKASESDEGGSQDAQDEQSNIYLQLFKRLEETLTENGAQQTCNSSSWSEQRKVYSEPKTARGTTFKSDGTMDLSLHSHRPLHYQERMNEKWKGETQSHQSDSSKGQVFTDLMRFDGQECVRTFGVGPSPCDVSVATSSSANLTSLDEIKMMVQSQVEARVAEKVSHYEKNQREMAERMEIMRRLLLLRGLLPPSQ
ncbi:hypothetical protein L1987_36091 [Smallanthus sonchifolius]|uniref:Uncharacterized protein n=1 Tax=Smallanthus sonchifolius TaxID=185202 RepID=A0ACB9HD42_9ASTR|nr:hypothetical protein L1987_36091 [Smallanthus sonchifolius]